MRPRNSVPGQGPRFVGLAKDMTAYGIAAIAHNIRKAAKFLALYGLVDPAYAGQYTSAI